MDKENKFYINQATFSICKEKIDSGDKNYLKVCNHYHYTGKYRGSAHSICNLRYEAAKDIPVIFYNDSNYDYHLIIKELTKGFYENFEYLGETTEKCNTFSVPKKKQNTSYKIKFIDNFNVYEQITITSW